MRTATPVQVYHPKARAYDPLLGQFLQIDPIGYQDDVNLYAYTQNSPTNAVDPSGLEVKTQGDCSRQCRVYDESLQTRGGSRVARIQTEIGTYHHVAGPERDPPQAGQPEVNTAVQGAQRYLLGDATTTTENINDIAGIHSAMARRLGQSTLQSGGTGGTLGGLMAGGGGLSAITIGTGNLPDHSAGSVALAGAVDVDVVGSYFIARGHVTGIPEPFDFNSNAARGAVGNAGVVAAGVAGEVVTLGRAQGHMVDYSGTIYFDFRGWAH